MAASATDKFAESTTNDRPNAATLTAIKTNGATSLTVDSTTGWPTDTAVHFTMYEVDANNAKDATTQRDYKGIVNSSTTINNVTVRGGSDREFPIGAKVICAPTAAWADDLVSGILVSHEQDGTLKDDAVTTDVIADGSVTNAKLDTTAGELGGAWADWTPTLTNLSGGTLTYAKYTKIGKTVFVRFRYALAGAGVSGAVKVSAPVNIASDYSSGLSPIGKALLRDNSGFSYEGTVFPSSNDFDVRYNNVSGSLQGAAGLLNSTSPMTWASGDIILFEAVYEAA